MAWAISAWYEHPLEPGRWYDEHYPMCGLSWPHGELMQQFLQLQPGPDLRACTPLKISSIAASPERNGAVHLYASLVSSPMYHLLSLSGTVLGNCPRIAPELESLPGNELKQASSRTHLLLTEQPCCCSW